MPTTIKQAPRKAATPQVKRIAFQTSRELDFLSAKELAAQTGHAPHEWPLVVLKELVDNALDACEEAGIAPRIYAIISDEGIRVWDNGPGIPPAVVESVLNFATRTSSREAYVAPDRGRQGNALKTLVAMPYVLSGERGTVRIEARGVRHEITLKADPIRQCPVIGHQKTPITEAEGTSFFLSWPDSPRSIDSGENPRFLQNAPVAGSAEANSPWSIAIDESVRFLQNGELPADSPGSIDLRELSRFLQNETSDDDSPWSDDEEEVVKNEDEPTDSPRSILMDAKWRFLQIASAYAWTNPHLSLFVDWQGERFHALASDPNWSKWKPSDPTDPHWYRLEELERLIAANLAHESRSDRKRTVRELVGEFRGLTSTAKAKRVLESIGLSRAKLADLANEQGFDKEKVKQLLAAMQRETRPVKPAALGILGQAHLAACCEAAGAEMESFRYKKVTGCEGGVPWVLETAFAWCPEAEGRTLITGVNWSPGIVNPFRQLGPYGESLDAILEDQKVGQDQPTILFLHIECARVNYADRGKSSLIVEK